MFTCPRCTNTHTSSRQRITIRKYPEPGKPLHLEPLFPQCFPQTHSNRSSCHVSMAIQMHGNKASDILCLKATLGDAYQLLYIATVTLIFGNTWEPNTLQIKGMKQNLQIGL